MALSAAIYTSIHDIPTAIWSWPSSVQTPFLSYEFLSALEDSGSVDALATSAEALHPARSQTGWLSCHLVLCIDDQPVIFLPVYQKFHSYGEYVFDHGWAHAYQRHGIPYYPKLINAIPFTPVTGARMLCHPEAAKRIAVAFDLVDEPSPIEYCLQQMIPSLCQQLQVSSFHSLFLPPSVSANLAPDLAQRRSVQFNWHNRDYVDFNQFLDAMTSRKRKSIRKEREKIRQQGVIIDWFSGEHLSGQVMEQFYPLYRSTYLKRSGHEGYLEPEFFQFLATRFANNTLVMLANVSGQTVAGALFLFNQQGLYGRYWGAHEDIDGLHFEVCYYQGIDFAIAHRIPLFNPGTQGEHKILRGFEPTFCFSNHYLCEQGFHLAVKEFVERESTDVDAYLKYAETLLPFKTSG